MGCWMSTSRRKITKHNLTYDGAYIAATPPTRGLSKRLWTSRISNASSSGVSSGCSTPTRTTNGINNRCQSPAAVSPNHKPIKKFQQKLFAKQHNLTYENLPKFLRHIPLDIELDEDDDYEGEEYQEKQQTNQQKKRNQSKVQKQLGVIQGILDGTDGYFTEEDSDDSPSLLVYTQNTSECLEESYEIVGKFDMEMHMMAKTCGIMPKTSSPLMQRRNETFDLPTNLPPPTHSYNKWSTYLEATPIYAIQNITRIPEAIAGQFSPPYFPAYSDLRVAQKYKPRSNQCNVEGNVTESIIVDLPVAAITTEL